MIQRILRRRIPCSKNSLNQRILLTRIFITTFIKSDKVGFNLAIKSFLDLQL